MQVSMPLWREGMPAGRAFFWGQLSGAVEPLGGALGAWGVRAAAPLLPLAMAFAAGAMVRR
jgi:zinc transporter ZupT